MKVAIVGSRTYTDYDSFDNKVSEALNHHWMGSLGEWGEDLSIISGGAPGTDTLAEQWAKDVNVPCKVIEPDYETDNPKVAPLLRNTKIAEQCDEMIAFWDGISRGTEDVIKKAVKLGKQVTIFGVNNAKIS